MALSHETRIEQQTTVHEIKLQGASANYSEAQGRGRSGRGRSGRGRSQGVRGNARPICQICGKQCHKAMLAGTEWTSHTRFHHLLRYLSNKVKTRMQMPSSPALKQSWIQHGTWTQERQTMSRQALKTWRSTIPTKAKRSSW